MPERRVCSSHPDFNKLDELARLIAIATNPDCTWNTRTSPDNELMDLPESERKALIELLKTAMDSELEGGAFADFINGGKFNVTLT
jgi:hypothetical protein